MRRLTRGRATPVILITLLYSFLALLWVLCSDRILSLLIGETTPSALRETCQGALFILVSAALFYASLQCEFLRRRKAESLSRRSEEECRELVATVQDVIFSISSDTVIRSLNPAFERLTGWACSDWIGKPFTGLICAEELPRAMEKFKGVLSGQTVVFDEIPVVAKKGGSIVLELTVSPHFSGGMVERVLGIGRDVTTRKRTEEQLRKLSRAVEQSAGFVVITDPAGCIEYVNPKFSAVTGYGLEEVRGKNPRFLKSGHTPDEEYKTLWETITSGREWRGQFHNRRKNGEYFWVSSSISAVTNEAGHTTHFVAVQEDITQRKRAEEELRASGEYLRRVIDSSLDMIITTEKGRLITEFNKAAEETFGYSSEEVLGKRVEILYADHEQGRAVHEVMLQKGRCVQEIRNRRKNGEVFPAFLTASVLRDSRGEIMGFMGISRDVTEQKLLEKKFFRAQRLESIGTLAGGIAHDLNNILAPILMSVEILRLRLPDEAAGKTLNTVEASAQRGADIVKQVLTFARGIEGERIPVQLRHLIADLTKLARETFPKGIQIETRVPDDLWIVTGDSTQLQQVLMNLYVNARDAMPDGGKLTLTAENACLDDQQAATLPGTKPGAYVQLELTDSGTGIPQEIMDKIFDPFFTTKEQGKGTGLGLPTVLGIVKSHGGFLDVESEVGRGTTFKVFLPATPNQREQPGKVNSSNLHRGRGELILVVDDEASILEATRATLHLHGFRTITAHDGAEALLLYTRLRRQIQVVLTDVMMPEMDGVDLVRSLRKMDPRAKIIASSGLGSGNRKTALKDLGVNRVLTKPYSAEELVQSLNELLSLNQDTGAQDTGAGNGSVLA